MPEVPFSGGEPARLSIPQNINKTVTTHHLSTVRNADQIIMIVDGRIVQKGNFVELIDSPCPFRTLASRQLLA